MNSTVIDLVPMLEAAPSELAVVSHLRLLRDVVYEAPDTLLPAVTSALDEASSPIRFPAMGSKRWAVYAGGIAAGAAGALVLASRNRRHLVG